jgi:hypothetical protein
MAMQDVTDTELVTHCIMFRIRGPLQSVKWRFLQHKIISYTTQHIILR